MSENILISKYTAVQHICKQRLYWSEDSALSRVTFLKFGILLVGLNTQTKGKSVSVFNSWSEGLTISLQFALSQTITGIAWGTRKTTASFSF